MQPQLLPQFIKEESKSQKDVNLRAVTQLVSGSIRIEALSYLALSAESCVPAEPLPPKGIETESFNLHSNFGNRNC